MEALDDVKRSMIHNSACKAAFDIALHDILAKRSGLPLKTLLGASKGRIKTDMSIGIEPIEETITDARTGLSFEIRYYPGDGMGLYRLHACWGGAVLKPEHIATLLG